MRKTTRAIAHGACSVTSSVFAMFYLLTLAACAVTTNAAAPSTPKDRSVKLSKGEKKLVFDLGYYVRLAGLDLSEFTVKTADGHGLSMARILPGKLAEGATRPRYPVLLVPGLMQASAAYCTSGPRAIGLVLARAGYDVWLGNNRGGFQPDHEGSRAWASRTWDWSMHQLATEDVPAMVTHVKKATGARKIAVVGHSQGTTQLFLGLSKSGRPELGESISSFSALAPAVYAGPLIDRWFLRMLRVGEHFYHVLVGHRAFLGVMGAARKFLPLKMFCYFAYIMFRYMLGWSDHLWNRHYRDRNFIFAPVYVSSKLMQWWLGKGGFADRKCIFESEAEPWFDHRFPPLTLFTCGRDDLVPPGPLITRLTTHEPNVTVDIHDIPGYSHLDVLWAADADVQVAQPLMAAIWRHVEDRDLYTTPEIDP